MQYDYHVISDLLDDDVIEALLSLYDPEREINAYTNGAGEELAEIETYKTAGFDELYNNSTPEEQALMMKELEDLREQFKSTTKADLDYRKCMKCPIELLEQPWMYDTLWHLFRVVNQRWQFDINSVSQAEILRYCSPNHKFDLHYDAGLLPADGGLGKSVRKLSMIIQLSDSEEYEGCDFEIIEQLGGEDTAKNIFESMNEEARKKGSVIVFPSFQRHQITPLISGERKSLVCWASGPDWR